MVPIIKKAGILLVFCACIDTVSLAQIAISADQASKYVGKTVDMTEMVSKVSYNQASKICMITVPDPRVRENSPEITIIIHNVTGVKRIHQLKVLPGNWLTIHAKLLCVKSKFVIDGNNPGTKWSVFYGTIDPVPEPPLPATDTTNKTGDDHRNK